MAVRFLLNSYLFGGPTGSTLVNGLLSYYKLDGNSNDSVGSSNGTDSNITYNAASGIIISGASFNGTTSTITTSSNWIPSMTDMTVSAWVNYDSIGTGFPTAVSNFVTGGSGKWFALNANPSSQMEFAVDAAGGSGRQVIGVAMTAGTWVHVVGIRDTANAELRIHLNYNHRTGTTSSVNTSTLACNAVNSYLGNTNGSNLFAGDLDEVGVWDRVLTLAEIQELYNAGSGIQYPF